MRVAGASLFFLRHDQPNEVRTGGITWRRWLWSGIFTNCGRWLHWNIWSVIGSSMGSIESDFNHRMLSVWINDGLINAEFVGYISGTTSGGHLISHNWFLPIFDIDRISLAYLGYFTAWDLSGEVLITYNQQELKAFWEQTFTYTGSHSVLFFCTFPHSLWKAWTETTTTLAPHPLLALFSRGHQTAVRLSSSAGWPVVQFRAIR